MNPKISVVTVTYNCESSIQDTIENILEQDYDNLEYIVVDGYSKDNTFAIISKYSNRINKIIHETDNGIFDAMNKAIAVATGDWICFINAGDKFHSKTVLSDLFSVRYENNIGVIHGETQLITPHGGEMLKQIPFYKIKSGHRRMGFCHQSVFVRTYLAKNTPFDTTFRLCADYNMIMNLYKSGIKFHKANIIISDFDMGGVSTLNEYKTFMEEARICFGEKKNVSFYLALLDFRVKQIKKRVRSCLK